MILHVNFSDGSNPWVCFSDDRKEIADHWKDWLKYHAETANIKAYCGGFISFSFTKLTLPASYTVLSFGGGGFFKKKKKNKVGG